MRFGIEKERERWEGRWGRRERGRERRTVREGGRERERERAVRDVHETRSEGEGDSGANIPTD